MGENEKNVAVAAVTWGAALLGAAACVYLFYPGYMSVDSIIQLAQGLSGVYNDMHPPVMSWLIGLFAHVLPGASGMLVFQNALFWSGLALLARSCVRGWAAPVVVLVAGFFPPVVALLSTIWKDVSFGAALLLAVALLVSAEKHPRRLVAALIGAAAALLYATSARHNGIFAIVPLAIWGARLALRRWRPSLGRRWALATGAAASALMLLISQMVGGALVHGDHRYMDQQIWMFDLAAISVTTGQDEFPAYAHRANPELSPALVAKSFSPVNVTALMFSPPKPCVLTYRAEDVAELRRQFIGAVLRHPAAYLKHRLQVSKALFAMGTPDVYYPFHTGVLPNNFGLVWHPPRATLWLTKVLERVQNSILFRGWAYLALLTLLLLAFAVRRSSLRTAGLAVTASGLLYALGYVPLAPVPDFRLIWWAPVSALAAALIWWESRRRAELPPAGNAQAQARGEETPAAS